MLVLGEINAINGIARVTDVYTNGNMAELRKAVDELIYAIAYIENLQAKSKYFKKLDISDAMNDSSYLFEVTDFKRDNDKFAENFDSSRYTEFLTQHRDLFVDMFKDEKMRVMFPHISAIVAIMDRMLSWTSY